MTRSMSAAPGNPPVTVVVVTWNGADLLARCLRSLAGQTQPHRVLVVDNASSDGTADLLARDFPDVDVELLSRNTGFAGGAQHGLTGATTPLVAFLNNDAEAEPGWLAALVDALHSDPRAVAVTSRMLLTDRPGHVNNAGGALTRSGVGYDRGLGEPDGPRFDIAVQVAAISGGAALVRRDAALEAGGFAPELFLYYEDTDLSWRLRRAGGLIGYVPDAVVHHRHSATTDQGSTAFAFFNQRNQLLVLVRNAPLALLARGIARFLAVTAARAVRPGPTASGRLGHRMRVLAAVARMVPAALAARCRLNRRATVSRREFCRQWLGVESRPWSIPDAGARSTAASSPASASEG